MSDLIEKGGIGRMAENETPQVGDTVYGSFGRYGRIDVREGKVVKVTPTGRVNVDFGNLKGIQFRRGWQVGGDKWHSYQLIDRTTFDRLSAKQHEQRTASEMIDRLRNGGFTNKAEAMALAEEIKALADAIPDSYSA